MQSYDLLTSPTIPRVDHFAAGQNACIDGKFVQCVDGKFTAGVSCGEDLQCVALPLVNSKGTSITCDRVADAKQRIANTGAKGGLTGKRVKRGTPTAPPACKNKGKRSFLELAFGKRIAQSDLGDVAESWQKLCLESGGDIQTNSPCVTLAGINGINSLLANADPCDQQKNADAMVKFAKSKGVKNKDALIANAKAYREHPRNALNIGGITPSTPFCQEEAEEPEIRGLVNKQLDGVDPGIFGGPKFDLVAFGACE
ncbi:hypothetical protein SISSUDRAFT_1059913 [Sistotremastrum suecicum HHB10207 ss-3]|uniref:Carbohydrate-binding module family 19 domain-containing protein n=1 Tax=Sistotremastrum suecicum HHB10207 ss-3 TaxID=1314776 RepID=A0A166FP61_9AGAM|nr:hypothetical protein SISSUDRAFT_1059913 [Sistotremastrum suecicum HHB10207 ss-3]